MILTSLLIRLIVLAVWHYVDFRQLKIASSSSGHLPLIKSEDSNGALQMYLLSPDRRKAFLAQ